MKLSAWAKQQGITYKTAWNMFKAGNLPLPSEQLPTGTIIIHAESPAPKGVALYARVSGNDQKADLDRQLARLSEYAAAQGLLVVESVREIGSGLNGHRRCMLKILANPKVSAIVVEHRERLVRFGFEYIEAALSAQGRRLIVLDSEELKDDIVLDLHEVIVSMCSRLYGKRSAQHRAQKAEEAIHEGGSTRRE